MKEMQRSHNDLSNADSSRSLFTSLNYLVIIFELNSARIDLKDAPRHKQILRIMGIIKRDALSRKIGSNFYAIFNNSLFERFRSL